MEIIGMSQKEISRLDKKGMSQNEAGRILNLGVRQSKRFLKAYRKKSATGLITKHRDAR